MSRDAQVKPYYDMRYIHSSFLELLKNNYSEFIVSHLEMNTWTGSNA
jgi:hypothetical protein